MAIDMLSEFGIERSGIFSDIKTLYFKEDVYLIFHYVDISL